MHAQNDNTTPPRSGMRRVITPWEYRHLRAFARLRFASASFVAGFGLCPLVLSYGWAPLAEQRTGCYWFAALMLAIAAGEHLVRPLGDDYRPLRISPDLSLSVLSGQDGDDAGVAVHAGGGAAHRLDQADTVAGDLAGVGAATELPGDLGELGGAGRAEGVAAGEEAAARVDRLGAVAGGVTGRRQLSALTARRTP